MDVLNLAILILSRHQTGKQTTFKEPVLTIHAVITVPCVYPARG